mmetsp:Transcript_112962/g.269224  ORF Transcript_112962/g.269224 Transcript_112962/m.269224 type:complete len:347 (-) Transcript_112962:86-1126(-)
MLVAPSPKRWSRDIKVWYHSSCIGGALSWLLASLARHQRGASISDGIGLRLGLGWLGSKRGWDKVGCGNVSCGLLSGRGNGMGPSAAKDVWQATGSREGKLCLSLVASHGIDCGDDCTCAGAATSRRCPQIRQNMESGKYSVSQQEHRTIGGIPGEARGELLGDQRLLRGGALPPRIWDLARMPVKAGFRAAQLAGGLPGVTDDVGLADMVSSMPSGSIDGALPWGWLRDRVVLLCEGEAARVSTSKLGQVLCRSIHFASMRREPRPSCDRPYCRANAWIPIVATLCSNSGQSCSSNASRKWRTVAFSNNCSEICAISYLSARAASLSASRITALTALLQTTPQRQ